MKKLNFLILVLGILMSQCLTSCFGFMDDNPVDPEESGTESYKENIVEKTYFADFIDNDIYTGDNFYLHAVNKWIEANPIPKGRNSISVQDGQVDNAEIALKKIATGQAGNDPVINQLIASYNQIDFDSDAKVLNSKLAEIDAATDKEGIYKVMAQLMKTGYVAPFHFTLFNYEREVRLSLFSPRSVADMDLTAENLKNYTGMDLAEASEIVKAGNNWKEFMITSKIVSSRKNDRRQAPPKLEKMRVSKTRGGFSTIYKELGLTGEFWMDEVTETMAKTFEAYNIDTQKALLKYFIANRDIGFIISEKKYATGAIMYLFQMDYSITNTLVSRIYSETQVKPELREKCKELCQEHRNTFRERIQNLQWMSDATKQKAIEKLDEMLFFVGWPDKLHSEWEVQPVTAPTGYQAVLKIFEQSQTLFNKLIGLKTLDALFYADWFYAPAFVANAFYAIQNNSFSILSSNMLPPIFDISYGEAYLYASLGSTIGHEMTHGFDSDGSKYNKYGKFENWWTSADKQTFLNLQDRMIDHFGNLSYYPGLTCNGEQTLAENIADLGGLNISFQTYMKHMEKNGATQETRDYEAREFFRAFAYAWAENYNEKGVEIYVTDTHSAPCLRVNGNVYQIDEFYRVFNIQGGEMYIFPKSNRITIW